MGTRWRVVGVIGVVLVGCVAIGAFTITRTSSKTFSCSDVGLIGPSAVTPEGALAAWLDKEGGDAADWKRGDRRTSDPDFGAPYDSYDFTPRDPISVPALKLITTICADPLGQVAGTLNPVTARAEKVAGGYVFSGQAGYLSGSAHSKWVMASAIVTRDQQPIGGVGGISIRSGLFPIERARNLDTWHVTGMRATGSSDYEFADVEVPDAWTFEPLRPRRHRGDDVASWIPLWSQLGGGLAANAVGAARNMIERFVELAAHKVPAGGNFTALAERSPAQVAVGEAQGLYQAARSVLMSTSEEIWDRGVAREPFDNDALARQRLGSVTAVRLAARAIDLLHDVAGMSAVASDTVLDRCWRDVHTMTQHIILSTARFEIAGRVLLGLDPASPVI